MMWLRRRLHHDSGLSLVEVLVVMALTLLITTIATTSTVQALRAQRRQVERVSVLNDAKIAMERMTREIRAANPLQSGADEDSLEVTVMRDAEEWKTTYELGADNVLWVTEEITDGAGTEVRGPRALVTCTASNRAPCEIDLGGERLFRYYDADEVELDPALGAIDVTQVRTIDVLLGIGLRETDDTVQLATSVLLRNSEVD